VKEEKVEWAGRGSDDPQGQDLSLPDILGPNNLHTFSMFEIKAKLNKIM
jgi:hypothetical protein